MSESTLLSNIKCKTLGRGQQHLCEDGSEESGDNIGDHDKYLMIGHVMRSIPCSVTISILFKTDKMLHQAPPCH